MSEKKLTPKQQAFIHEYLKDWNGTQAAIRAGYSSDSAKEIAYDLLTLPHIKEVINNHLYQMGINRERVLAEMAAIAFSDVRDHLDIADGGAVSMKPISELPSMASKAIKGVKERSVITESKDGTVLNKTSQVEYLMHDKVKTLEMLAKHTGVVTDSLKLTGDKNNPLLDLSQINIHEADAKQLHEIIQETL